MHVSGFLSSLLAPANSVLGGGLLTGSAHSMGGVFSAGALVAGTLLAGALLATSPRPAGALEVGEPFPDIVLPSLDGTPMSVSSFRGRKLAVHVWASW